MNRFWRCSSAVIASVLLFTTPGCKKNEKESVLETSESMSLESSVGSEDEPVEITKPEPTGFEDYIDETIPSKKLDFGNINFDDFFLQSYNVGSIFLGYDNPQLQQFVKDYFNDDSLNTCDIPYYSYTGANFDGIFNTFYETMDLDYVRFVLEENDLRFLDDQISYEYLEEKFPQYISLCKAGGFSQLDNDFINIFVLEAQQNGYNGNLIEYYENSGDYDKTQLACFMQLAYYNYNRDRLAANMPDKDDDHIKYGFIETGETLDGEYVWCPTELQYRVVKNRVKHLSKCENINILVPETREDLIASGIDVEKYDKMCEELFGGAKMA